VYISIIYVANSVCFRLGVITRWLFRLTCSMGVSNIYVVGFKILAQIMLIVAYSTLLEAIT
jgi:hypothetical protein